MLGRDLKEKECKFLCTEIKKKFKKEVDVVSIEFVGGEWGDPGDLM